MGKAKRGATSLSGILAVDKPQAMTSHDVVDEIRRITGEGRVGHTGTLDPMATGLLLVCVGPATRLSDLIASQEKVYQARVVFGFATDTDDADGTVIASAPLPDNLADSQSATQILDGFVGSQEQIPPQFAAIKQDGLRAYKAARRGMSVDLKPRVVTVHSIRLMGAAENYWDIEAHVSKGTYIRSLARDLGEAVGSKAHLAALRRIRCGQATIEQAHSLEELRLSKDIRCFFLDLQRDLGIPQALIPKSLQELDVTGGDVTGDVTRGRFSCHVTGGDVTGGDVTGRQITGGQNAL